MDTDPKAFLDVPLNTRQHNDCSPTEPGPEWRGLTIQAPRQVRFKKDERVGPSGAFAAIPLCGFWFLDVQLAGPNEPMVLVAVDKRTGATFSGPVVELDPSPEIPPFNPGPPLTAKQVEGLAGGSYFNPNLADFVELPRASATYDVHVEFRGFKSNAVTIELVEEKD